MSLGLGTTLMTAFLAMAMTGTAVADEGNRFTARDGGMVGGEGSFSEGTVTVFHHFRNADRQELNARIADLEALIQSLEGQIQAKEQRALALRQNYHTTRARMNQMRNHYRL